MFVLKRPHGDAIANNWTRKGRNGNVHYSMHIITVGTVQYTTFLPNWFTFTSSTGQTASSFVLSFHYDGSRLNNPREVGRFLLILPDAYARTPKISPSMEASRVVPTSDSPGFLVVGRCEDERWLFLRDAQYMIWVQFVVRWCRVHSLLCCHVTVERTGDYQFWRYEPSRADRVPSSVLFAW